MAVIEMTVTLKVKVQAFHIFTVAACGTRLPTRRAGEFSLHGSAGTAIRRNFEPVLE